jgi:hypothetical protein
MDHFSDFVICIFICIFGGLCVFAPLFGFVYFVNLNECSTYHDVTGRNTQFKFGTCYVKDGNEWYDWSEYKLRNATVGVIK